MQTQTRATAERNAYLRLVLFCLVLLVLNVIPANTKQYALPLSTLDLAICCSPLIQTCYLSDVNRGMHIISAPYPQPCGLHAQQAGRLPLVSVVCVCVYVCAHLWNMRSDARGSMYAALTSDAASATARLITLPVTARGF